jgi:hypothetical protein
LKKINRTAEQIFTFKILIKKNFAKFKAKKDVNRGLIIRISLLKSCTTKWFKSLKCMVKISTSSSKNQVMAAELQN